MSYAALNFEIAKFEVLLTFKFNPVFFFFKTPVYLAAVTNQPQFVYYLIQHGADPTIPADHAGNTPLHYAAQQGFVNVIEAIMQGLGGRSYDDFIDRKNFEGESSD